MDNGIGNSGREDRGDENQDLKIMESWLKIVQRSDEIKKFVLPTLDSMMLNREIEKKQLKKFDQRIRAEVDRLLNAVTILLSG
jgi:hypothetical protein